MQANQLVYNLEYLRVIKTVNHRGRKLIQVQSNQTVTMGIGNSFKQIVNNEVPTEDHYRKTDRIVNHDRSKGTGN